MAMRGRLAIILSAASPDAHTTRRSIDHHRPLGWDIARRISTIESARCRPGRGQPAPRGGHVAGIVVLRRRGVASRASYGASEAPLETRKLRSDAPTPSEPLAQTWPFLQAGPTRSTVSAPRAWRWIGGSRSSSRSPTEDRNEVHRAKKQQGAILAIH
jgi:hypothetical protein